MDTKHDMKEASRDPKNAGGVSKAVGVGQAIVRYVCQGHACLVFYYTSITIVTCLLGIIKDMVYIIELNSSRYGLYCR
jgi:hypothetical protein